jgi:hypothetical protein
LWMAIQQWQVASHTCQLVLFLFCCWFCSSVVLSEGTCSRWNPNPSCWCSFYALDCLLACTEGKLKWNEAYTHKLVVLD